MLDIITMLDCLKQDKGFYIDDDTIRQYIEDNMQLLIDEISKEVN